MRYKPSEKLIAARRAYILQISIFYRTTNLTDTKEISKQLIDEADEFVDDILKRKAKKTRI